MTEEQRCNWGGFLDWCSDNGVEMEYEGDWGLWWKCWKAAIDSTLPRREKDPIDA